MNPDSFIKTAAGLITDMGQKKSPNHCIHRTRKNAGSVFVHCPIAPVMIMLGTKNE